MIVDQVLRDRKTKSLEIGDRAGLPVPVDAQICLLHDIFFVIAIAQSPGDKAGQLTADVIFLGQLIASSDGGTHDALLRMRNLKGNGARIYAAPRCAVRPGP